jgi:hypothetical protein
MQMMTVVWNYYVSLHGFLLLSKSLAVWFPSFLQKDFEICVCIATVNSTGTVLSGSRFFTRLKWVNWFLFPVSRKSLLDRLSGSIVYNNIWGQRSRCLQRPFHFGVSGGDADTTMHTRRRFMGLLLCFFSGCIQRTLCCMPRGVLIEPKNGGITAMILSWGVHSCHDAFVRVCLARHWVEQPTR